MTAHLGVVCGNFALQVGDRLLTTVSPGNTRPWDEVANKTLVIASGSSNLIVSYSGLAHIGRKPTDQWLAERIVGFDLEPTGPGAGLPTRIGHIEFHGGSVRQAIRDLFEKALPGQPRHHRKAGLELIVTGFALKRLGRNVYRPRPVAATYQHNGERGGYKSWEAPRFWPWNTKFRILATGSGFDSQRLEALLPKILAAGTADRLEEVLVSAIRHRAAEPGGDVIGTECMSVYWDRFSGARRIRFFRDVTKPRGRSYSPWVINRWSVVPPTMYLGGGDGGLSLADARGRIDPSHSFVIETIPPEEDQGFRGSLGQPRPRP